MAVSREHYVYVIFRPDGSPCYIGKGKGNRWQRHFARARNRHLRSIIEAAACAVPIVIIRSGLSDSEAIAIETAFIAALGRKCDGGPLVNLTLGGDGVSGRKMSDDERERRRLILSSPQVREKMRLVHLGKVSPNKGSTFGALSRERMRIAQIGKKQSPETIAKRAKAMTGKKRSAEYCARMSELRRGEKRSEVSRKNMSAASKGRVFSEEHKSKIRKATAEALSDPVWRAAQSLRMKAWWVDKKAARGVSL